MRPRYVIRYSAWPIIKWWGVLSLLAVIACLLQVVWNGVGMLVGMAEGALSFVPQAVWDFMAQINSASEPMHLLFWGGAVVLLLIPIGIQAWLLLYQKCRCVEFYENRIVVKWGVFDKDSTSYVFSAIYMVGLKQSFMQRILNYGTLSIDCAGNWTDFNMSDYDKDGIEGSGKKRKKNNKDNRPLDPYKQKDSQKNKTLENVRHPKKAKRFLESRISAEGLTNIIHN